MPRVIAGDCLAAIAALAAEGIVVDAIVTDPPYGLEFMGKDWDKLDAGLPQEQVGKGRRGKGGSSVGADDRNAVRMQRWHETWARQAYRVLKPGGYLLAFGGARTHHRLFCAIEDSGFVIQDTIMWLYGQGFPKGKSLLKPAWEPIIVAYKPGGPRALQIDECRIGTERTIVRVGGMQSDSVARGHFRGHVVTGSEAGRWPANVCHDGSAEVMAAFAAFGETTSRIGNMRAATRVSRFGFRAMLGHRGGFTDCGTAARFFYCAKASKADRAGSKHPTVKPLALMRWLVALVTPPGGLLLDPFAGSGTTRAAALAEGRDAILIEREPEYIADIRRRLAAPA